MPRRRSSRTTFERALCDPYGWPGQHVAARKNKRRAAETRGLQRLDPSTILAPPLTAQLLGSGTRAALPDRPYRGQVQDHRRATSAPRGWSRPSLRPRCRPIADVVCNPLPIVLGVVTPQPSSKLRP
jgi:hypothetical protein